MLTSTPELVKKFLPEANVSVTTDFLALPEILALLQTIGYREFAGKDNAQIVSEITASNRRSFSLRCEIVELFHSFGLIVKLRAEGTPVELMIPWPFVVTIVWLNTELEPSFKAHLGYPQ